MRCKTCDGFPCKVHAKTDAEVAAVGPALATGRLTLKTNAKATRLVLTSDGRRVNAVEYESDGGIERITAPIIVLSASAVNSVEFAVALGVRQGASRRRELVGRGRPQLHGAQQHGSHEIGWKINDTKFQKTICINDFYFGDDGFKYPMGNIQGLGKLQSGMLTAKQKYLPDFYWKPDGGTKRGLVDHVRGPSRSRKPRDPTRRHDRLHYTPNNMVGHKRLVSRAVSLMRKIGFKLNVTKHMGGLTVSHQCGTVRFGTDPARAALNEYCRSFDHENLFVVDASFFPSSAAVNPALTIAAQAIRVADHMARVDFGITGAGGSQ